jgi:L-histidine N-alpha-methyltransferase
MHDTHMITAVRPHLNDGRVRFFDFLDMNYKREMMRDIRTGLGAPRKSIPARYLYDSFGSVLFEGITITPEYYLTRTELSILDHSARHILEFLAPEGGNIVELGSGSTVKIKKLLDAANTRGLEKLRYIPVDICGSCIESVFRELPSLYPDLELLGLKSDFTSHLDMIPEGKKLLVIFGSTIGNFSERESLVFLEKIRRIMTPEDRLLIGMDMVKSVKVLEAAYNDSLGITRQFNLNILSHINRELNADFNTADFEHMAFFDAEEKQIEMRLRARLPVSAWISDLSMAVDLRSGETIRTETCRKFDRDRIERLFSEAGFWIDRWFTDPMKWFSLIEVMVKDSWPS